MHATRVLRQPAIASSLITSALAPSVSSALSPLSSALFVCCREAQRHHVQGVRRTSARARRQVSRTSVGRRGAIGILFQSDWTLRVAQPAVVWLRSAALQRPASPDVHFVAPLPALVRSSLSPTVQHPSILLFEFHCTTIAQLMRIVLHLQPSSLFASRYLHHACSDQTQNLPEELTRACDAHATDSAQNYSVMTEQELEADEAVRKESFASALLS